MGKVHIYTAKWQPATRYRAPGLKHVFTMTPRQPAWADCCKRMRWASHVEFQVYYDMTRSRCINGHGCRRPARGEGE